MSLLSFSDVKRWILSRAGEATDATSDWDTDTTDHLIATWHALYSMQPWLGLRKFPPGTIITPAAITTTTITITVSTTALTLSAAPAASIKDYIVLPTGKSYYFRVTAHTAGQTSATVDAAAVETLTAQACTIAKLEYDLPSDCGVLVHSGLYGSNGQFIAQITEEELWASFGGIPSASDPPGCFARIGQQKIRFGEYPTKIQRFEVPYIMEPADPSGAATVALPPYLRPVWAEMALALLYEEKRDSRVKAAVARSEVLLNRAKSYETMLAVGLGQRSNERRNTLLRD